MTHVVALDMGSGSGRAVLGSFANGRLTLQEVHRFPNVARDGGAYLTWDFAHLFEQLCVGIRAAAAAATGPIAAVAVDTWGVDYGLLGADGGLLQQPRAYRDPRAARHLEEFSQVLEPAESFARTGVEPAAINTAVQLFADLAEDPGLRSRVDGVLFLPDLFHYVLSGARVAGQTIASTSALARAGARQWDDELLQRLGIPATWLAEIAGEGTVVGRIRPALELPDAQVVLAGTHDTAAAVHALSAADDGASAFLSCGSWSLLGVERPDPVTSAEAFARGFTNEAGMRGQALLMKNLTGLWMLQEAQRHWARAGEPAGIRELLALAEQAPALSAVIDTNDPSLAEVGDIPSRVASLATRAGAPTLTGPGHVVRVVLESLAATYRRTVADLEVVTGERIGALRLAGGGSRNELLCQWTADACGIPVHAGPAEATAIGSIIAQLEALGEVAGGEGAQLMRSSFAPVTYEPEPSAAARWNEL